jgi:hypothetical protein
VRAPPNLDSHYHLLAKLWDWSTPIRSRHALCGAQPGAKFGVTKTPLRAIFHNASFLGEGVPVYEIRDETGENNDMLVNANAKGRALAKVFGAHPVVC